MDVWRYPNDVGLQQETLIFLKLLSTCPAHKPEHKHGFILQATSVALFDSLNTLCIITGKRRPVPMSRFMYWFKIRSHNMMPVFNDISPQELSRATCCRNMEVRWCYACHLCWSRCLLLSYQIKKGIILDCQPRCINLDQTPDLFLSATVRLRTTEP